MRSTRRPLLPPPRSHHESPTPDGVTRKDAAAGDGRALVIDVTTK